MVAPAPLASLASLARARALLPTDDPDANWLAAAIDRFMVGAEESLDAALGLNIRGTPARTLQKIRQRDVLIVEFAETVGQQDVAAAAKEISRKIDIYRTRCWPREQQCGQSAGTDPERAMLFAIFNEAGGIVPSSPKQIARILRSGHPVRHRMSLAV